MTLQQALNVLIEVARKPKRFYQDYAQADHAAQVLSKAIAQLEARNGDAQSAPARKDLCTDS